MEPRSIRLNNVNRNNFIDKVMEATMPNYKRPTQTDFLNSKRNTIYDIVYGEIKEKIEALPDWATVICEGVWVRLNKEDVLFPVPIDRKYRAFETGEHYRHDSYLPIRKFDAHEPLTMEYKAHIQKMYDWDTKRRQLKAELTKVVEACNTSSQLYAAWPKALEYAECFPYKGSTRAVPVKVSSAALDITMKITDSEITLPEEN